MPSEKISDPLNREVVLHEATWTEHILKGHPELNGHQQQVVQAIASPEEIQMSAADADCRVYDGKPSSSGRRLAVVADVVKRVVKTAYFARKKKTGVVEWSR